MPALAVCGLTYLVWGSYAFTIGMTVYLILTAWSLFWYLIGFDGLQGGVDCGVVALAYCKHFRRYSRLPRAKSINALVRGW